jgi:hypothetical protein
MVVSFTRTWQRPPTREELDGLIRDRVREEVYAREATALGLDKDDAIIRRRLRQKMEFLTDDIIAQTQPSDDELSAYLTAHPDAFRVEQRYTFNHVYLNPAKHGDNLARDIKQLLAQLHQAGGQGDISELGDAFQLERAYSAIPRSEIDKQFGDNFASKLNELPVRQWGGPVESGYGMHLVFISERTAGRVPALAEVRQAVSREWSDARRLEANEKYYNGLLSRYVVVIQGSEPTSQIKVASSGAK